MNAAEPAPAAAPAAHPHPLVIRVLGKAIDACVIAFGGALAVLIFTNVVMHAFGKDLAWMTELGELMMVWVTFLGGAAAAQRGAHMSINEFLDKLSPQKRRLADAGVQCFTLVVLGLVAIYGMRIVSSSWDNVLTTLEWPMAWQYMPLPLGMVLSAIFVGWDLVQIVQGVPRAHRYAPE